MIEQSVNVMVEKQPTPSNMATDSKPFRAVAAEGAHELVVPKLRGVSHAVACGVSIVAAVVVVVLAPAGRASVAVAVYGIGLVALFGGSALYHRWSGSAHLKAVLRRVDHSMIFVFIAASYTPIAVLVLHGWVGWALLGLAWLGAGIGIGFSMGWVEAPRVIVAGSYLALGWLAVIVIPQLIADLQLTALILIAGGGVLYSGGAVVYVRQRPNLWPHTFGFHELFHALVILAAAAYYVALIGWMLRAATG
jgi:hemolysin III